MSKIQSSESLAGEACSLCGRKPSPDIEGSRTEAPEGSAWPICDDCDAREGREAEAAKAYLSTFDGPWGLKASTEDGLLSILSAAYPWLGFEKSGGGIERLRAHRSSPDLANEIYEELECEGLIAGELVRCALPMIDEAFKLETIAAAESLGLDVERERCDSFFLAELLWDVLSFPEGEERQAAVARANDGSAVREAGAGLRSRTIAVHLSVTLDRADERSARDIAEVLTGALDVGLDPEHTNLAPQQVSVARAEVQA